MGSSGYGGYESPMVKQELAKLEKGGEKRRSALVSLRACVDKLDASTMPRFLSQISDSPSRDHQASESRPFAISLFQDVAQVHGRLLIPHIPRIMATVIRSLSSSGSSSSANLHDACSKVVSSIPRYTITPSTSTPEAEGIFRELCDPLLDALVGGKLEPLTAGAAVCLQALLESDKWKYAPEYLAGELCSRCASALRDPRGGQTVAHIHLARALVRLNLVTPDCGLAFLRSSKEILRAGGASWQQRAAALQLVRGLMLGLDRKHLASESESIAHIVEQIRLDRMPHVRNEAAKALQTLKAVVDEEDGGGGGAATTTTRMLLASAEKLDSSSQRLLHRSLWGSQDSSQQQQQQLISFSPPPESPGGSSTHSSTCRVKRSSIRARGGGRRSYSFSSSSSSSGGSGDACDEIFTAVRKSLVDGGEIESSGGGKSQSQSQVMENLRYHSSKRCSTSSEPPGAEQQCVVSSESYQLEVAEFLETTTTTTTTEEQQVAEESTPVQIRKASDTQTPTPQKNGSLLTAEDFIRFTTPRRLVRSLQTLASPDEAPGAESVNQGGTPVKDDGDDDEEEAEEEDHLTPSSGISGGLLELLEASSETGWSVRDNPIAAEHNGSLEKLERDWELDSSSNRGSGAAAAAAAAGGEVVKSLEVHYEVKKVGKLTRCWTRARGFIELVLVVFVCTALLLPLLMVVIRELHSSQGDVHALVPT